MSEDYVAFVHGLGTDRESLSRERQWLIKRSKTHGLTDEEEKRLRLLGTDDASMSPSLIQPVHAAVDCGEAKIPNFRDSSRLSIDEKLMRIDLVHRTAIDRAVRLGKSGVMLDRNTLTNLETEIDVELSKDVSNWEEVQRLIDRSKKLLKDLDGDAGITRRQPGGLTVGRWNAEKKEWVTMDEAEPESESGLTAGRWNAEKRCWEK